MTTGYDLANIPIFKTPFNGQRMDEWMAEITKDWAKKMEETALVAVLGGQTNSNDPQVKEMQNLRLEMRIWIEEEVQKALLRLDAFNKVLMEELTRELRLEVAIVQEQINDLNAEFEDE